MSILKLKQEAALKQLDKKTKDSQDKCWRQSRNRVRSTRRDQTWGRNQIPNQKTDEPTKALQLLNASLPKYDFKISGQIGEPGQNEKLSFVSSTHQIDYGIKKGYQEPDIINAVIRAILPHNVRS